jgi:signal transduction histidine kinase
MVFRIIIALLIALAAFGVNAEPRLLHDLAVLEDKPGTMTIDAVAGIAPSLFKSLPSGGFSGGYTNSVFWFRFTVAQAGETWLDIQPPVLEDLRLFEADPQLAGSWLERRAGAILPFSVREVPDRSFVFKMRHADAAPHTYYLRMATTGSSVLSARLMAPNEFIRTSTFESGLLMASLAVALTVALLSIHTWLWMRDSLTPWFVATLVNFACHLLGISGFLQQYVFPLTPELSFYWLCTFSFVYMATFNGLYRRLFEVGRERRVLFWIFEANCWVPLIFLPLALSGWRIEILPFFLYANILMACINVVLAFNLWRRDAAGGLAMFLAMMMSMAGILIFLMHILGLLEGGFFVWHSLQFTALGSELALYLALGARFRNMREARVKAEQDATHEYEQRIRQGHFLAMLAHEMRTSLTVLRMAVGSQPMKPGTLAKVHRAMDSMCEVIDQSVQVERLADGRVTIEQMPCDITILVHAVIADSRDPARIRSRMNTPLSIQTDGRLLRIVMSNLVDNALKYGKEGEQVDVELLADGEHLCMVVSNAIGIAGLPDSQRIFEKYYRAPRAHAFTGSGLGLHIAAALAQLLGGELRYQPTDERVVFELRLQAIASFAAPSSI